LCLCTISLCLFSLTVSFAMTWSTHLWLVLLNSFLHLCWDWSTHLVFEKAEKIGEAFLFVGVRVWRIF
jgi:hypothetical protein